MNDAYQIAYQPRWFVNLMRWMVGRTFNVNTHEEFAGALDRARRYDSIRICSDFTLPPEDQDK